MATIAKINANGQWIERSEHVSLNALFDRVTPQEMENYAANGTLPTWFERMLGAAPSNWTAAIKLVDEQIVIFQKGRGNVADISYFGTPIVTRVRHAIGEGEVKDVEEGLSQLA
jgi:hypothetical protein